MDRQDCLKRLQTYNFAAYDMLLHLDTHPNDKKAFAMFKDLVTKTQELKKEFEKAYGPLTPYSTAQSATFNWLDSPWPWEKEANK